MRDDAVFGLAGLWEVWTDGTTKLATVCLITTEANGVVSPYHDRMPVIVAPEHHQEWLGHDTPEADRKALLRPYPAEAMEARPANPLMNKATAEGLECLVPPGGEMGR
jgi:putative SOS response-associated peptidase YedK